MPPDRFTADQFSAEHLYTDAESQNPGGDRRGGQPIGYGLHLPHLFLSFIPCDRGAKASCLLCRFAKKKFCKSIQLALSNRIDYSTQFLPLSSLKLKMEAVSLYSAACTKTVYALPRVFHPMPAWHFVSAEIKNGGAETTLPF
ncbi:MAG: hypothetical protein ACLSD3_05010 [Acutalibacteraceae bacterium]